MEFHGKCPGPLWKVSMEKFPWQLVNPYPPWNSMENVLILHGDIFHGNPRRNFHVIPWKLMS